MERVATILEKLQVQVQQNAPASTLLVQAQLLVAELQFLIAQPTNTNAPASSKVAVLPSVAVSTVTISEEKPEPEPAPPIVKAEVAPMPMQAPEMEQPLPTVQATKPSEEPVLAATLSTEKLVFELNTSLAETDAATEINQQLKQFKQELADKLQNTPIKDLKKAISINDRFVFIQELFRGDEAMYERSIKTINGYSILPEATYWIQRELKVKLGWDNTNEVVRYFDDLVSRRFS